MRTSVWVTILGFSILALCRVDIAVAQDSTSTLADVINHSHAVLKMQGGDTYRGAIERESGDSVWLRTEDGVSMTLPRSSLALIQYDAGSYVGGFSEFGVVLGTPAGANLVAGYHWDRIGLRLNGGWLPDIIGAQIGVPITLVRGSVTSLDVSPIFQTYHHTSHFPDGFGGDIAISKTFTGWGVASEVNINGFSIELGMLFETPGLQWPAPAIQMGYVHEFR